MRWERICDIAELQRVLAFVVWMMDGGSVLAIFVFAILIGGAVLHVLEEEAEGG